MSWQPLRARWQVIGGPAPRPLKWFDTELSPDGFLEVDSAIGVKPGFRLRGERKSLRCATALAKLWRAIAWTWSPESERESSEAIVRNMWLHWFPAKITRAAMSWNYSMWLGTVSASLFLILTITGVMLMFFYVPSTERAYGSIKDLEFAVSFGRILRNQHRWAAEGMVAVVFLHMARVFFTGAYRGTRAANWLVGVVLLAADAAAFFHRISAAVGSARVLGGDRRHQHRDARRRSSAAPSAFCCSAAIRSTSRRCCDFTCCTFSFCRCSMDAFRISHVARAKGRRTRGGRADSLRAHDASEGDADHQELLDVRADAGDFGAGAEFHRARGAGLGDSRRRTSRAA